MAYSKADSTSTIEEQLRQTHIDGPSRKLEVKVKRARKIERFLSQPFFVAEIFTRIQGSYVCLNDTIIGFSQIVNGELDIWSEGGFYLKGTICDIPR